MEHPLPNLDYGIDAFAPNFDLCPSARDAQVMFANVSASDILFVPGSFHHAAWNVDASIGISQNFLSLDDYHSVMESFLGYTAKVKRELQRRKHNIQINVPFDFLAIRDFFRLLSTSHFLSNWRDGPMYWHAGEATAESFARILRHLQLVLDEDLEEAWRPAFFCNTKIAKLALQTTGAWRCLSERLQKELDRDVLELHYSDVLVMLEPEFEHMRDDCTVWRIKVEKLMAAIEKAMSELDHEIGLSRETMSIS